MELIRYFFVAVVGLVIDTGVSWLLFYKLEILLTLSSAFGFLSAAIINYVMHELWTFRHGQRTLSTRRGISYIVVLILTLITRIVAVHALQLLLTNEFHENKQYFLGL